MLTEAELQRKRVHKAENRRTRRLGYHQRQRQSQLAANLAARAAVHNMASEVVAELAKKLGVRNPLSPRSNAIRRPQRVSP